MAAVAAGTKAKASAASAKRSNLIGAILVNVALAIICIIWIIPTLGLLISSFRERSDVSTSGWWTVFPHQEYISTRQIQLTKGIALDQPIAVENTTLTDDQLRAGYSLPNGEKLVWANRRARTIDVQTQQWTSRSNLTVGNYQNVLLGQQYTYKQSDGSTKTEQGENMVNSFISSLTVTIPATLIPILLAAFAAYAFAWMRFRGRRFLFAMVVALLVVPGQVALIPLLQFFSVIKISGTYLALWLVHTGFGLSLAIYLLYNYISGLPRETLEAAFIDGATPFTIFLRLILPLSVPALASFAIFQFMWVWNDFLNALIFLGTDPAVQVVTIKLQQLVGSRGQDWHLLTAGAFVSMLLPLVVFFSLQRYFVRGLLAGSVKG